MQAIGAETLPVLVGMERTALVFHEDTPALPRSRTSSAPGASFPENQLSPDPHLYPFLPT